MFDQPASYRELLPGEPAPWFKQRCTSNPSFTFDTVAGRYVVLCFIGTAADADGQATAAFIAAHHERFDDSHACLFGVSVDPADEAGQRLQQHIPGIRHFWDTDQHVSRLYGALPASTAPGRQAYRRMWVVLNPNLQVRAVLPFQPGGADRAALLEALDDLPPVDGFAAIEMHAPVIILPGVFEPELCRTLIAHYDERGGTPSGFMREVDGRTVPLYDAGHKVRNDVLVEDEPLRRLLQQRVEQRVAPMIRRVHHFIPTRMERYLIGCYDAHSGGHFRAHRDNTTKGTAHRRFAMSVNLNDDFDGGELSFPEFGSRRYKPPAGAAVIFSCSLLHQVDPMREGRRYAFLPFIYDEAAAQVRQANLGYLGEAPAAAPAPPAAAAG